MGRIKNSFDTVHKELKLRERLFLSGGTNMRKELQHDTIRYALKVVEIS